MDDLDEMIALDAYTEYMRDDGDDAHGDFIRVVGKAIARARADGFTAATEKAAKFIEDADWYATWHDQPIADARAAGYAEAIEKAAKELERMASIRAGAGLYAAETTCLKAADNIRALAPAKEES